MNANERRSQIIAMLQGRVELLNASKMAEKLGVSRQVIVTDIALLRARGHNILSTPRGYLLECTQSNGYVGTILCRHGKEAIRDEFYQIVDYGGEVLDVSIDHPIYGLISAALHIRSRYDADSFIQVIEKETALPLSALTEGFHTHKIRTESVEDFERIKKALNEKNILEKE